jgi:hypothetical protein
MDDETLSLLENNTWELVKPEGRKIVSNKWVSQLKPTCMVTLTSTQLDLWPRKTFFSRRGF